MFFCFTGLFTIIFITICDPGQYLLRILENRFEKPIVAQMGSPQGFIILGGAVDTLKSDERKEILMTDSAERIMVIPILMRKFPDAEFIFSGKSFGQKTIGEGSFAQQYLNDIGFDPAKLKLEAHSTSTYENAIFTAKDYMPVSGDTSGWYLVTSAWHMPRAMGLFRKAGWTDITAYPVDYRSAISFHPHHRKNPALRMYQANIATKEFIALLGSYLFGYTDFVFPK